MKPIKKIIEEISASKLTGYLLLCRQLAKEVQLAQLWPDYKQGDEIPGQVIPRSIYLIQAEGRTVGGVEALEDNLYAFLLPPFRGKGMFSSAMKQTILPHILQGKPLQRLQIQRSEHGERKTQLLKKIALSLGFMLLKEDQDIRLVIDASKRPVGKFVIGQDHPVAPERKASIRQELSFMAYRIMLIRSELELTEGVSYFSDALGDTIRSLHNT